MHDTPLKKQVSIVHYSNTTRRCKFTLQSIIVFIESAPLFIFGSNAFHDFAHDRCNEGKQVFGFAHDSTTREASVAKIPGFRNTPSFEKNPVRNETKGSAKKWSKGPGLNTSLKQNRAFSKWGWKVGNYNGAIMSGCWHDTKNNLLGLMPSIKIQFLDSWRTSPPPPHLGCSCSERGSAATQWQSFLLTRRCNSSQKSFDLKCIETWSVRQKKDFLISGSEKQSSCFYKMTSRNSRAEIWGLF